MSKDDWIVLIGFSRGAIVGTIAAAVERRLRSVALLYGAHFDALEQPPCPAERLRRSSRRRRLRPTIRVLPTG